MFVIVSRRGGETIKALQLVSCPEPTVSQLHECASGIMGPCNAMSKTDIADVLHALQFSGATIQIDQSKEPTEITLLGSSGAVSLAQSMIEVCCRCLARPTSPFLPQ